MTDLTKLADALEDIADSNSDLVTLERDSAREAARILRAAAAVDVAGLMTDRQISVINFALHRFASHAHQNANAAGQDIQGAYYKKGAFEAFLKDAEDAEELLSKKPYAALESALRMALAASAAAPKGTP